MLQHDVTLLDMIREESVPAMWRYLLFHAKHVSVFPRRPQLLQTFHARLTKHRAKGKLVKKLAYILFIFIFLKIKVKIMK